MHSWRCTRPCSPIAYIKDREMGLPIAKEKDTKKLDQTLLERFAVKAGLPKHMVVETAEKTVRAWSELARDLPLDNQAKEQIDEQLKQVPLTRQFLRQASTTSPETSASKKANQYPKARSKNERLIAKSWPEKR